MDIALQEVFIVSFKKDVDNYINIYTNDGNLVKSIKCQTAKYGNILKNTLVLINDDFLLYSSESKNVFTSIVYRNKNNLLSRFGVEKCYEHLKLSNCSNYLIGVHENSFYVWNIHSGQLCANVSDHLQKINCILFSYNGGVLCTTSHDTNIFAYDFYNLVSSKLNSKIHTFSGHSLAVTDLITNERKQDYIYSCSLDCSVKRTVKKEFRLFLNFRYIFAFSLVNINNLNTSRKRLTFKEKKEILEFIDTHVYCSQRDLAKLVKSLLIWSIANKSLIRTIHFDYPLLNVKIDWCESVLFVSMSNAQISKIFLKNYSDLSDENTIVLSGHSTPAYHMMLNADCSLLYSISKEGLFLWDVKSNTCIRKLNQSGIPTNMIKGILKNSFYKDGGPIWKLKYFEKSFDEIEPENIECISKYPLTISEILDTDVF
ncbi:hypothetical protein A3Q56_04692 [Intoshia linei]|uniref:Uncharacterized protein n=1 Tax=Intoshia linei TaxID=1819745 RepID=A0A177B1S8_9BILA|nr:hypothetical protein A3Q56_04692 [Intoshia linei]